MFIFDEGVAVSEKQSDLLVYSGEIRPDWGVNEVPNGGYLMAVLANAMIHQIQGKVSAAVVTANYIARGEPGKADVAVEKISSSKQFDRFQANLLQGGIEKIRALGTFVREGSNNSETRYEKKPPVLCPVDDCVRLPDFADKYSIFKNLDVRLDPVCAGWLEGRLTEKSEHKGWIRFTDDRPYDLLSTLLLADSFPPPVFVSQGMVAWVPTIEYSVNVRFIPETKWLKGVFRTRFITGGLLEEDGELWDENDNLVAVSRQIAQFKKIV